MSRVARFRVATRATGHRRQVYVHVYDNQQELARIHTEARGFEYDPLDDIAGGVVMQTGYRWPEPDVSPIVVMRLWTGQLTGRTIAHEAVHCATTFYFMDSVAGWDSRARTALIGDDEPLAYAVGDIAAEVTQHLYRLGLIT